MTGIFLRPRNKSVYRKWSCRRVADLLMSAFVISTGGKCFVVIRTLKSLLLSHARGKKRNFDLPKPNKETHRPLNSHDRRPTLARDSKKRANKESAFRYISNGAATNFYCARWHTGATTMGRGPLNRILFRPTTSSIMNRP